MGKINLVSSDLNGTLVHQHTMSDMIRIYLGQGRFEMADEVFKKQSEGTATMEDAFSTAGPLTKGLTLRQAIEYTKEHMRYMGGFNEFLAYLNNNEIPLVINSTGYSVTIYAIRERVGRGKIHGQIGNFLKFGMDGNADNALSESELEQKVIDFFSVPYAANDESYDRIKATGEIELGIIDEGAKARLIIEYAKRHFPEINPRNIVHMGDTMGDSKGIQEIASLGGFGIAFNYNRALMQFLEGVNNVYFIDEKSENSDLRRVIPILRQA